MTQRPSPADFQKKVDPEQFAADYLKRAERMYADSVRQTRALRALAAEATSGPVTVTVGPSGHLEGFAVEGERASATQLTQGFTEAYREAVRLVNEATAEHSGGLAEQVTSYGPPSEYEDDDRRRPPQAALVEKSDDDESESDEEFALPSDAAFDTLLDKLDQGDPEDLGAILNDPEFQRLLPSGSPDTWQQQLEREVQQISRNADRIAELSQSVVGEHTTRELTIEVNSAGSVQSLRFHSAVGNVPATEVGEQVLTGYREAAADASRQLDEALAELGVSPDRG